MKKQFKVMGALAVSVLVAVGAALGGGYAFSRHEAVQASDAAQLEAAAGVSPAPVAEHETAAPALSSAATEPAALTQEAVYTRLLNAVDYYTTASLQADVSLAAGHVTSLAMEVDMGAAHAHEIVQEDGQLIAEQFCDGERVLEYNYASDVVHLVSSSPVQRQETALPDGLQRVVTNRDNTQGYYYRANPTNLDMASFCLFPQEFAFGFLSDFSRWEITGCATYLGRECVVVKGQLDGDYARKQNVVDFEMAIDRTAGILLRYQGFSASGERSQFVTVNTVTVDAPALTIPSIDDCESAARAIAANRFS